MLRHRPALRRRAGGDAHVVGRDVTERRLAEETLGESERKQRRLALQLRSERARLVEAQAVARVGSWDTDLVTLAVNWSPETFRIFEVDPATFSPTHPGFLELVHPDDRAAVDTAFRASLADRALHRIEHRIVLPDGRSKLVEERWHQTRMRGVYEACVHDGTPFDEELEILGAKARRVRVRAVGEAVRGQGGASCACRAHCRSSRRPAGRLTRRGEIPIDRTPGPGA